MLNLFYSYFMCLFKILLNGITKKKKDEGICKETDTHLNTHVCFNKIAPVRYEIVMVLHLPALLYPDKVLGGVEVFPGASTG